MTWDPFGTLARALWIGGAQWAGKSTVANLLAERHGITAYHHDYHNARGHYDRQLASGRPPFDAEEMWVRHPPATMAASVLAGFPQGFAWILDDLRALVSGRPVLAEGWGLRPELVASIVDRPQRMVVMVPTEEFRQHQLRTLPRAGSLEVAVLSDPELGQRQRIERDRLVAADAVESAGRLGIRVIEVDGRVDADGVADIVADHFSRYLPRT